MTQLTNLKVMDTQDRHSVDLVGPLPLSSNRNKYVLTTMDGFSKYTTSTLIPSKEAAVVANALMNTWVCQFGCPSKIHSNGGNEFENRLWAQLCDRLQISKSFTPSYNPSPISWNISIEA